MYRFTAITIKIPTGPLHPKLTNWSLNPYEDAKDKAKTILKSKEKVGVLTFQSYRNKDSVQK